MKYFRRTVAMLLALALAVTMMIAFAAAVMAANVCQEISGSSKQTTTFTVKTGSRWLFSDKLKLTQTKGRLKFDNWGGQDKEYSMYDRYSVTYKNESNGKTKTAQWTSKNLTLKLVTVIQARRFETSPKAYVLSGDKDRFIEPRTMQNRFKRYIAEADIADANFHATRHTFATRCVEVGFDVKTLSEILGHANVNITLNR